MRKVLVADDGKNRRQVISGILAGSNYAISCTGDGQSAIEWMKKNKPDLVLCNSNMSGMTGLQLLAKIKEAHPEAKVVMIADESDVKDVVAAFRAGADDYIINPQMPEEILTAVTKALGDNPIVPAPPQNNKITAASREANNNQYISGCSSEFAEITSQVRLVAPTNFSVIIYGESGSGKEAIAQQIHRGSKRADKPFVAIDCGTLSKELAGSELFGHERGAFTGALGQKTGSLESANGGTIFLDEIGNLPYEIQASLLRVVQERKIRRVGGVKDICIDVRIIIASNVNLRDAAKAGKFREDLYHRFNEFSIAIPSLRDRRQDILQLAHHFLQNTNAELGKNIKGFTREVEYLLTNYAWYGNIRELKNVIKRATLLTTSGLIEGKSLPSEVYEYFRQQFKFPLFADTQSPKPNSESGAYITYEPNAAKVNVSTEQEAARGAISQYQNQKKHQRSKSASVFDVCIPAN